MSEGVSECERVCEWLQAWMWVTVSENVSGCKRECEWLQVRVRKNKTVLKPKEQKNKLSGPKPNRSFSLASFFCFFSASVPLMFRPCSSYVLPLFCFVVQSFPLFSFSSFFLGLSLSLPRFFFSSLFLGVQIMWRPRFFASSNMRRQKKCGVKFRFKRPCFLMMDFSHDGYECLRLSQAVYGWAKHIGP